MTGITAPILWSLSPDIMRRGHLPCGKLVKVLQRAFCIIFAGSLTNRYMAKGNELFRSRLRPQRIEANLKSKPGGFCLVTGKASLVHAHMTGRTVLIGLRMADIATRLIAVEMVYFCILRLIAVDLLVAVNTFRSIRNSIAVCVLFTIAMHLLAGVTLATFHIFFLMYVRLDPLVLTEILLPNPASVTCGTNQLYGRLSLKEMPIQ